MVREPRHRSLFAQFRLAQLTLALSRDCLVGLGKAICCCCWKGHGGQERLASEEVWVRFDIWKLGEGVLLLIAGAVED